MTFEALHLTARWLGCQRIDLESCSSTNDEAARLARAGAKHGTVVIAERQTSGRGRDGRVWQSPPGGLYLSAVVRPSLPIVDVPPMTLAIGIGLCDAIRFAGAPCALKWPNDVLVAGRKLAGVLVEAQSQGNKLESVVVGIGINLDGELADDIADSATTLTEASGRQFARPGSAGPRSGAAEVIDREAFILHLLADVERWIDRYVAVGLEAIVPAWTDRMAVGLVARANVAGGAVIGELTGLDLDGAVLLRDDDGNIHRVRSGDVEMIRQRAAPNAQHAATKSAMPAC